MNANTPTTTPDNTATTSAIIYALENQVKAIEQLRNTIHKYHDNKKLKITIMKQESLLCTGNSRTAGKAVSRSTITNILLHFICFLSVQYYISRTVFTTLIAANVTRKKIAIYGISIGGMVE